MKRFLTIAAVFAFSGAFLAACGSDKKSATSSDTTAGATDTVAPGGATVTLVAMDISFDQSALTAKAGSATTFVIKNEGKIKHNLTIKDLKINADAEAGKTGKATASPAAGTYEYHCEYHPDAMKGTLTVS